MATQQSQERYYYADGQRIPLLTSKQFVAVRGESQAAASALADSLASAFSSPTGGPVQVLTVPEYDIAVLAVVSPDAQSADAGKNGGGLRAVLSESEDVLNGPPVFETEEAGPGIALIPVGEILVRKAEDTTDSQIKSLFSRKKLDIKEADSPIPGCYIVSVRDDADTIDAANALEESELVASAEPNFVTLSVRPAELTRTENLPTEVNGGLLEFGQVDFVNPDTAIEHIPQDTRDLAESLAPAAPLADPAFSAQWNLTKIRATEAWAISSGNPSVSVAVLDEGCDIMHEDISYKLPGYDAFSGDNDPTPNGNDAHGTACAGVVAMRRNNGKGGVGVAPGCRIVPIRIAQGVGGGFWSTTPAKVATGIYRAVDAPRNADVLSNSYGLGPSSTVTAAFQYARTHGRGGKGACIAAAAGNSNAPPVLYPARLSATIPGFMAVSATNQWDQLKTKTSADGETWWGSSFGPEVNVAAPGVKIYSPDIMGPAGYSAGNYTPTFNGTSSATPHVAGLMALVLSVDPHLRSWEVEDIIKLTARDLGPTGRDPQFGFGRIDCRRALEAASKIWYQINVVPVFLGTGRECFIRATIRMYNPGINTVRLNALTLRSLRRTGSGEQGRFEYRPDPGNILAPRTSQSVRFNDVLLRANGNRSNWSYRWTLNWGYTFWRPSAPGFPLGGDGVMAESTGEIGSSQLVQGAGQAATGAQHSTDVGDRLDAPTNGVHDLADFEGDSVVVDRRSRSITVTIR